MSLEIFTIEDLIQLSKSGELGQYVYDEIRSEIVDGEHTFVSQEIAELAAKNAELGGSPHGFFYNGRIFALVPSFNIGDISEIHPSLLAEAKHAYENRFDVQQDIQMLGNFLSFMNSPKESWVIFPANMPEPLFDLSPSLSTLRNHMIINEPNWEKYQVSRDNKKAANFFAMYDRVHNLFNRYLFRRAVH